MSRIAARTKQRRTTATRTRTAATTQEPILDTDGDGYNDDVGRCPYDAEDFDGEEDEDGCPDKRVVIEKNFIKIKEKICEFGKAVIQERSFSLIDEIAETIVANPQLKKIRIEGHTDSVGSDMANLKLSSLAPTRSPTRSPLAVSSALASTAWASVRCGRSIRMTPTMGALPTAAWSSSSIRWKRPSWASGVSRLRCLVHDTQRSRAAIRCATMGYQARLLHPLRLVLILRCAFCRSPCSEVARPPGAFLATQLLDWAVPRGAVVHCA